MDAKGEGRLGDISVCPRVSCSLADAADTKPAAALFLMCMLCRGGIEVLVPRATFCAVSHKEAERGQK